MSELHEAETPQEELRPSVRTTTLAKAWECDITKIQKLIRDGELEAHGVGRSVRVYIDSANAYQKRNAKQPRKAAAGSTQISRPSNRANTAANRSALAFLRKRKLI